MAKQDIELEILTNGVPDLKLIPKEIAQTLLVALEQQVVEMVRKEEIQILQKTTLPIQTNLS